MGQLVAAGSRARGRALGDWPLDQTADWLDFVNEPQAAEKLAALRGSVNRGRPFGEEDWQRQVIGDLGARIGVALARPTGNNRNAVDSMIPDAFSFSATELPASGREERFL